MKKVLTFLAFLYLTSFIFAASLRDYVCIVRPKLSEHNETFLKELSSNLNARGYKKYSEYIDNYLLGTFGSGFIYTASDGKSYILTNRHVVQSAEFASITFENEDGTNSEYKDLKISAVDDDVDLAIIALPDDFKKRGLTIKENLVKDGDAVWSAGFPGLGGEPAWQLGNGVVSNSRARIKQLLNPEISTLIQHTAEIDGGNSGGPLLVKADSEPSGFYVAGINTWKAIYRQNTNFAIPSSLVKTIVQKNLSNNSAETFEKRIKDICSDLRTEEDFSILTKYISDDMVSEFGKDVFIKNMGTTSTSTRDQILGTFISDPIEGLRLSLAYRVWKSFGLLGTGEIKTGESEKIEDSLKISFSLENEKSASFIWIFEKGEWRIKSVDLIKSAQNTSNKNQNSKTKSKSKNKKSGVTADYEPYRIGLNAGIVLPFESFKPGFEADFNYLFKYASFGFFFLTEKTTADVEEDLGYGNTKTETQDDYSISTVGAALQIKIPVDFGSFLLSPFVEGKLGVSNFFAKPMGNGGFCGGFGTGAEFIIKASDDFGIGIGSKYEFMKYVNAQSNMFSIYLTIRIFESYFI